MFFEKVCMFFKKYICFLKKYVCFLKKYIFFEKAYIFFVRLLLVHRRRGDIINLELPAQFVNLPRLDYYLTLT